MALKPLSPPVKEPLFQKEILPPASLWIWILLAGAAVFIRFYKLTTLSRWPLYDEGFVGYFAVNLSQKWDWSLFYGSSQAPPLFIWLLSFLFKGMGPSLAGLWFLPAFLSALAVPLGYLAARQFFPRSFSFLCSLFLGVGFWGFYVGRFAQMPMMVLPAECLVLGGMGYFLKQKGEADRKKFLLFFGFAVGAGFYIHTSWAAVAGFVFLTILFILRRKLSLFSFFLFPLLIILSPLMASAFQNGYGSYLRDLWAFGDGNSLTAQLKIAGAYLRELFWGINPGEFSPELVGGGLMNPIWVSFFLLGLLELLHGFRRPLYRWLLLGLALFLLPGILTKTLETFRILPLLPVLIPVCVLGFYRLALSMSAVRPWLLLTVLMIPSAGLDFYHLLGPYQKVWDSPVHWKNSLKSIERSRANEILRAVYVKRGPGCVFSDFMPGFSDQTLDLSTSSLKTRSDSLKPAWAACLVNINYQHYLSQKFPNGKSYWLSPDLSVPDGGMMLWVLPLDPSQQETFAGWQKASLALKPFIFQSLSYVHGRPWRQVLEALAEAEPSFRGDPLLRSFYWEKMADTYLRLGLDFPAAIRSLQTGLDEGVPSAHLYYRLGTLYAVSRENAKSQTYFSKAAHSPFNQTNASQFLAGREKHP